MEEVIDQRHRDVVNVEAAYAAMAVLVHCPTNAQLHHVIFPVVVDNRGSRSTQTRHQWMSVQVIPNVSGRVA